jgi:hypothetical protein
MKRSNKWLIFAVAIAAMFLVTSCTGITQGGTNNNNEAFVGGTVGLNTYLIDGMPPAIINDANTFPFGFGIAIENQGEADVGPGTDNPFVMVRVEGINPEQFGTTDAGLQKVLDASLKGSTRNYDGTVFPGEITSVIFEPLSYIPDIRGNTQFTIRADICYDYQNDATALLCIKDDVLQSIQDTSICSLTGEKNPQNSGGPIHITSVVENPMAENKIQLNFKIEHVGIGEFFGRPADGTTENCDFSSRNFNKYFVDVEVSPLQDSGLTVTCSRFSGTNAGRIKLYQGAATTISCTIERTRTSAGRVFQEPLNIKLKYRYGQFLETPLVIQDVTNT